AEKVRISGGGRCNFTNIHTAPANFLSENPHFAKSALARYTPLDFCDLLATHSITWHEKTLGQLFCDGRSSAIIEMLLDELSAAGGTLALGVEVTELRKEPSGFTINTSTGAFLANRVVIATGGLSIPKMGATGFAYDIARQFEHAVIPPRPALVPLTFSGRLKDIFASLSGVAANVVVRAGRAAFEEAMLFTHRGLSGPAVLQASSYWREGEEIGIDLRPQSRGTDAFVDAKTTSPKRTLAATMADHLPRRLIEMLSIELGLPADTRLADLSDRKLEDIERALGDWRFTPTGTEGWRTAEVTAGGIDTAGLSSKTMESRNVPGLYFIGECVDVTGWLGGYNFQWAWASAMAAGRAIGLK
ncbi:MAG: NAD(P)/FAD-dependent oxidoreductase, partial [Pseudomonadota bacterium]